MLVKSWSTSYLNKKTSPKPFLFLVQLKGINDDQSVCIILLSMNDKRLAVSFKTFVEKVFLSNLKRTDPQYLEWNKFARMIGSENINYEEISNYV